MDVRWIGSTGVEACGWAELDARLAGDDGFLWIDIPSADEQIVATLAERFGFHQLAVRDILERSHLPKIHAYPEHLSSSSTHPRAARRATSTWWNSTSSSGGGTS